jgi:endonuclease YncB( thermonuclease family)
MSKLLLLAALVLPLAARAQIVGQVVGVSDGDTLVVKIDRQVLKIHVRSIDAPELGQPYGERAWQSLAQMCDARTVSLDDLGIGKDRRVFGGVECAGVDAAAEQVKRGLAWSTARDSASPLRELEAQAQNEHKGLWGDAAPVPPWQWSPTSMR